jgi:hypothetical protein
MNHIDTSATHEDIRVMFGLLRLIVGNDGVVETMRVRLETMLDRINYPKPVADVMKPRLARTIKEERE